MVRAECS